MVSICQGVVRGIRRDLVLPVLAILVKSVIAAIDTDADDSLTIVRRPYNSTGFSGTEVLSSVGAVDAQPLHYQWRFDGADLRTVQS